MAMDEAVLAAIEREMAEALDLWGEGDISPLSDLVYDHVGDLIAEVRRLRAIETAARAWVAAYREQPAGIMHSQWMAKATAERDARQCLYDAVQAAPDAQEGA